MAKNKEVVPTPIAQSLQERKVALQVLAAQAEFDPKTYLFDDRFKPGNPSDFPSVHTIPEMMSCLESQKDVEASGVFIEATKDGRYRYRKFENKAQLKEGWKRGNSLRKMREARFRENSPTWAGQNAGLVGDDFVPLLGGPFNKQPYLYDYLRAHAYCFHEYHHHPLARAIVHITRDFVLGGGYRVDSEDEKALVLWRAFEEANQLEQMMEDIVKEASIYGENMIWWLPNNETFIGYNDRPGQEPPQGLIPRIRLIDPSTCWEIVTMPEDIHRVLFYWLVFPTQYQIKTGSLAGQPVPTSKFITQQIAASDVMHFKYNCVSNEKRGRSDLFPVLGYLKWVRDCINYKLIALKKQAAWTEDVIVQGSQADVDQISAALRQLGEFEPAGSRFVHTDKIKREYLATAVGSQGKDETIMEGISMIAAGTQIPVTYFGLSMQAGASRAGAVVGTEPVAKKFERRQLEVTRVIKALWRKFQDQYGIKGAECSVTFPEIITQDRTAKLKDIKFAEDCGYIARSTAAPIAAKELELGDEYDYDKEKALISEEEDPPIMPNIGAPLTAPAGSPAQGGGGSAPKSPSLSGGTSPSAMTSQDRADIKNQDRTPIQ